MTSFQNKSLYGTHCIYFIISICNISAWSTHGYFSFLIDRVFCNSYSWFIIYISMNGMKYLIHLFSSDAMWHGFKSFIIIHFINKNSRFDFEELWPPTSKQIIGISLQKLHNKLIQSFSLSVPSRVAFICLRFYITQLASTARQKTLHDSTVFCNLLCHH